MNTWVNTERFSTLRILSAALKDAPRLLAQLATPGGWVNAKNRIETLTANPQGPGLRCEFEWSSALHACLVFPPLGSLLMKRAFAQWPISLEPPAHNPPPPQASSSKPDLSFIIPFRGTERLPQLQATVRSILAQSGASVECIVIEQSNVGLARHAMPPGTRYLQLPHPQGDPGWRKSWAYNVAAKQARAKVLVCHDGDILVPTGYAQAVLETLARGYDNVFLQRFLFYLNRVDSERVQTRNSLAGCCPDDIRHNWVGGTLAIRREAYFAIGGFDERFVDWGGEDNEFHNRCATLHQCRFGFVPFVHLWHPPQTNKSGPGRDAAVQLMNQRLAIAPAERIKELSEKLASGGANPTCVASSA